MNILLSTILRGFYLILYIQYGSSRCWFWKWEKCLSFVSTRIYLKTRYYKYIAQAVLKITISLRDWKPKTWNVVGISVTEDQFLKPKKKKDHSLSLSYRSISLNERIPNSCSLILRPFSRDKPSMAGTFIDNGFHPQCWRIFHLPFNARHRRSVTWLTSFNFPLKSCNRTGTVLISLADL